MARGAITPGAAASPVQPIVNTRKNVPMNSAAYRRMARPFVLIVEPLPRLWHRLFGPSGGERPSPGDYAAVTGTRGRAIAAARLFMSRASAGSAPSLRVVVPHQHVRPQGFRTPVRGRQAVWCG